MLQAKNMSPDWYTPESEEDEEKPSKFKIKPLNGEQFMEVVADSETDRSGDIRLNGRGLKLALRYGIIDWENIEKENGIPLKFSVHNLKLLPMEVLSDLASEIVNRSAMEDDETKNS